MTIPRTILPIAAVCCLAGAPASELVVRDVGLRLALLPTDFDFTVEDQATRRSGSDAFDSHYGVALDGLYSFTTAGDRHGLLAGIGLEYATAAYGSGDMTSYGVTGAGGYGLALIDRLDLRLLARVGFGWSDLSLPGSASFAAFDADGGYLSYGAELGVAWAVTDRVIVDLAAGWRQSDAEMSGGRGVDVAFDTAGFSAALGFSWRLTNTPWRLE